MRNTIVYLFCLGFILTVCYLIADLTLKNFLSEERLRVMLIDPVQDQLGRQVEIGSIKASVFSGIGIKDIVIKEKSNSQEFITIANFRLKYDLLPLFEKRLVITELVLDEPTIHFIKDTEGTFNFADLTLAPRKVIKEVPPPELQKATPLPMTLVFNRIRINHLNLTFTDQSGKLPAITSTDGELTCAVTLGKTLTEARYQGNLELIVNSEYRGRRPVVLVKSNFDNQLINFRGELNAELDKLVFNGQLATPLTTPDLTLDLQGAKFDLENLLPALETGRAKKDFTATDPTTTQATPTQGSLKIRAHGKLTVAELHQGKLSLQNLNLNYKFTDSILAISELTTGIFGGSLSGKADLDFGHAAPSFRGQFKADKMQLAELMLALDKPDGYLTGDINGDFSGRGTGGSWPEISTNLDGQGRFTINKGGMTSSPVSQSLARLFGLPELNNLKFDKLTGTIKVADGQATLDANLSARPLSMQTKGNVGLNGSLDLPLSIKLSQDNSRLLQERAAFSRYLTDSTGRTTVYLKLKGTIEHPDLSLNSEGSFKQLGNTLGQKLGETLGQSLAKQLLGN